MPISICSILGVVCAFFGLGVCLLALISLLPVNLYNAIMSCIKLKHAILLFSDKSMIPAVFFVGNILVALISLGLFYIITRKEQKKGGDGKTDNVAGGGTASKKSAVNSNQISNHNVFSHHKHSLMNGYTYSYVAISVVWALIGSLLLYTLVSNGADNNEGEEVDMKLLMVINAMRSQLSVLWINVMVLTAAVCTMGVSSLFFIMGRKKRNQGEARPLISVV